MGRGSDLVKHRVESLGLRVPVFFIHQQEQRGTAHALRAYMEAPESREVETILVTCVDTPLIDLVHMEKLYGALREGGHDAVVASFTTENPENHGRIVRGDGPGFSIVEDREAGPREKDIKEVNSGLYVFKRSYVAKYLSQVTNDNQSGEYYLTDIFRQDRPTLALHFPGSGVFRGINTTEQLHDVERIMRLKKLSALMEKGVRILDKYSTFVDEDVLIGAGSVVGPHCLIEGKTRIGPCARIESSTVIRESTIGDKALIKAGSYIVNSILGHGVSLGPYAHLRPKTVIGDNCRIGNFVEIKQSLLAQGVKVSHLSYVGDAEIGEETNIGCGFITCNYDGQKKHLTVIGQRTFIGSDSQTVAPVKIGDRCYVASGSTINQDMDDGDFAIARSRQVTKKGMAKRFLRED